MLNRFLLFVVLCVGTSVQADPFDGFFSGSAPAHSLQQVAEDFDALFSAEHQQPDDLTVRILESVDPMLLSMRLVGSDWFLLEPDTRSDVVAKVVTSAEMQLKKMQLDQVKHKSVVEGRVTGEFVVTTLMTDVKGRVTDGEWTIRLIGSRLVVVDISGPDGSFLVDPALKKQLDSL